MTPVDSFGNVERCRKKEFAFHYSPDKKLVHVVAKLQDHPGAFASLLKALGTRLNLMSTSSYVLEDGCAIASSVGETLFQSDTARSIQQAASSSVHVMSCQVWESHDGLLIDQFHSGIQSGGGESYVLMHRTGLADMFMEVRKVLGSGGDTILYLQGKNYGRLRVEACASMFGPSPASKLQELSHIYEALGFGSTKITANSAGEVKLILNDDFECDTSTRGGKTCSFTRGLAEGSIEAILKEEMTSEETRCRLRGDDECEFVIRKAKNASAKRTPSPDIMN
jgi:predicted hydrocarbon binding protein